MEPTAAISIIETNLRYLVADVYSKAKGNGWLPDVLGESTLVVLRQRLDEEAKRREPYIVDQDLLSYTHLYEIRIALVKNWELFSGALGKKREFEVLIDQVEDYRNAPAHSRELLPFERSLLEGIAGLIRTNVTLYRSSQGPDSKHYPVIESVRDSFGNIAQPSDPNGLPVLVVTGLTLEVGQEIVFECRGWDPQGRELTWKFRRLGGAFIETVGTDVSIRWSPTDQDVGSVCYIEFTLSSSGKYHRKTVHDDVLSFHYSVEPPAAALLE